MEYLDVWTRMISKQCETCKKTDGLLRCAGCNTYFYCSREHQVQDRPIHKSTCNSIKNAKKQADDIEVKLRADGNVDFNNPQSSFWNQIPSRLYLKARFLHGEMLIRSWRQQGIEDALALYLGILKLDRGDHQGCRHLIPALFLRLNRDQECYDFLKWWATKNLNELEDYSKPYLDIKNADAVSHDEVKDIWLKDEDKKSFGNIFFLGSLLLLKCRLYWGFNELNNVHDPDVWDSSFTQEQVIAKIRGDYPGDILDKRPEILLDPKTTAWDGVEKSVKELMAKIHAVNEHYLPMILFPGQEEFGAGPTMYTRGSEEEARMAFIYTFNAWMESRDAMEVLKSEMTLELYAKPLTEYKVARRRWKGPSPRQIMHEGFTKKK